MSLTSRSAFAVAALLATLTLSPSGEALAADRLVVYSARIEALIKPMFEAYSKETGVVVLILS